MKITNDMINNEIRLNGKIKGMFLNLLFSNEKILRGTRKLSKKVLSGKKSRKIKCEEIYINKKRGGRFRVCVYKPLQTEENATGVLWIHGGGYAIGAPEMDINYIEELMSTANCIIISPDYTLSTEEPYPAAIEDCYETLLWVKENVSNLGIREDQIFVGGVSAGGGLTIAVTLMARDRGDVKIAFQMPLYPMLDDMMSTVSAVNNNAPIWNSKYNELAWKMYLGDLYGTESVPKYAAPAREIDYSNLPPAYTFTGDIEPFYDEIMTFFGNLRNVGTPVKVDVYKGCYHAFEVMSPNAVISKQAINGVLREFKFAVDNYFTAQETANN